MNFTRRLETKSAIVDGKISGKLETGPCVGKNKVEIYAKRKTGQTVTAVLPQTGTIEVKEEYIPAPYNQQSTTIFEVKPGTNKADYDLKP